MTIVAHGRQFTATDGNLVAILADWKARDHETRPVVLRGCEHCVTVCMQSTLCTCCKGYGLRTSGGTRARRPRDSTHVTLMTMDEFHERAAS